MHGHPCPEAGFTGVRMRRRTHASLFLGLVLLCGAPRPAVAARPLVLDDAHGSFSVGPYLEVLEDKGKRWSFEDVLRPPVSEAFRPSRGAGENLGISNAVFWARFKVENASAATRDWLLAFELPFVERIDLFIEQPDGSVLHKRGGSSFPFSQREVEHPSFLWGLHVEPGASATVLMRIETRTTLILAFTLWKPGAFAKEDRRVDLLLGVGIGIVGILIVYNFLLFLTLRDRNYLLYVLFLLTFGAYQGTLSGLPAQYLWPNATRWGLLAPLYLGGLSQVFGLLFTRSFLGTRTLIPRTDLLNRCVIVLSFLAAHVGFVHYLAGNYLVNITGALASVMVLTSAVLSWRQGYRPARLYLIAWAAFACGGVLFTLTLMGFLEFTLLTRYGFLLGFCAGGILLSLALGDRMLQLQRRFGQETQERRRAEEAARQTDDKLRAILRESRDVVLVVDPEGGEILSANAPARTLLGYDERDLVGGRVADLFPEPERAMTDREIRNPPTHGALFRSRDVLRADGSLCPVDVTASLLPWNRATACLVTLRDATDRRRANLALEESERRHRLLFESVTDVIYSLDRDFRVTSISPSVDSVFGFRPVELVGKTLGELDLLAPECLERARADALRVFRGERIRSAEYTFVDRAGGRRIAEVSGAPLFQASRIGSILCVARDVTDRKRIENELREHRERLEETVAGRTAELRAANEQLRKEMARRLRMEQELLKVQRLEALGVLAGGLAHDFNNLLAGILTNVSAVRMYGDPDEEVAAFLRDAEEATLRARGLAHQLLTFAKGGEPVKSTVSLPALIRDNASFALSGSSVRCEQSLDGDLRLVEADAGQLGQVIQNLVLNAEQAMPGGGLIRISAENVAVGEGDPLPLSPGRYVRVSVEDQGTGIPPGDQGRIFDPFYTTKPDGSGLGLSTAFSIAKKHGGHISLASRPGVGSTFHVYLPASENSREPRAAAPERPLTGEGRILLIEDEEHIRRATGHILGRFGYEVALAADGAEGLEQYRRASDEGEPFDLVIMDLTIPGGMGGKEAIRELIRLDPEARVIVASGYANDPVMSDFRSYGFRGMVVKPFRIEDLGNEVSRVMAGG